MVPVKASLPKELRRVKRWKVLQMLLPYLLRPLRWKTKMKREMRKQNAKCNAKTKRTEDYLLKQRELEDLSKQLEKQLVNSARDIATGSKRLPM